MIVQHLPRLPAPKDEVVGSPAWARDRNGNVMIRCNCGIWMLIDHEINPEGIVHPSLVHDGCGWHVFVQLDDWRSDGHRQ